MRNFRYAVTFPFTRFAKLFVVAVFVLTAVNGGIGAWAQSNPSFQDQWLRASDRSQQRIEHQAITLRDGRVMVMGGYDVEALDILFGNGTGSRLNSVEIYDPASDLWETAAPMPQAAGFQWAALLQTGQVLVCGNFDPSDASFSTFSALYDPRTDTWTNTGPLPVGMTNDHAYMRAMVLRDGRVLIAGGGDSNTPGPSTVSLVFTPNLSNPALGSWDYTRLRNTGEVTKLHRGRATGAMAMLGDGRVLSVGGIEGLAFGDTQSSAAADLFDSVTGEWTALPDMPPIPGERGDDINTVNPGSRWAPIAETLPDGRVLVAGGLEFGTDGVNLFIGRRRSALIFDPSNLSHPWTITAPMNRRRWFSRSAVLRSGLGVLVTGGGADPTTSEIFDPVSKTWALAASFPSIDTFGSQLSQINGNLLLTGGFDYDISPPDGVPQLGSIKSFIYLPGLPAQAVGPPEGPETTDLIWRLIGLERKLGVLRAR